MDQETPGQADHQSVERPPIPDPIASGELPTKAKIGRPKGATKEAKADKERAEDAREKKEQESRARETASDISGIISFIFHIVASRAGPHWELDEEEAERLAYRFARVEQKWGGVLDKYAPEFALVGCAAAIVYPRLIIDAEKAEGKKVDVEVFNNDKTTG